MISVVMVQHNNTHLTLQAVESLRIHHASEYEIIIVDNASEQVELQNVDSQLPGCTLIYNKKNLGFGAACNIGAHHSLGEVLLFLNNDTIIQEGLFGKLEAYCKQHPACGAVGLGLENADGSPQFSLGRFPTIRREWLMRKQRTAYVMSEYTAIDWATGAALAVPRKVFSQIGGFDESYFMYYEDIDLCRRVHNAGYAVHYLPELRLVHLGGGSQPDSISPHIEVEYRRSQLRYYTKYNSLLQRMLLSVYLCLKYGVLAVGGSEERQDVAMKVLALISKGVHAHWD